jgi:hypothetical protein
MTRRSASAYRNFIVLLAVVLGLGTALARWGLDLRPRGEALRRERQTLQADRLRLAETRARLLQLGSEGIAERNRALRAEVERREALAPAGSLEPAAAEVRERFATLAARYGVHAPSFEHVPVRSAGELQIGGLRIRAAGSYHALGTWITEALSQERLLDVQQARLEAVPDTLTRRLRDAAAVPPSSPGAQVPPAPATAALELSGARPLDAVVEFVVQWYALPAGASNPAAPETR